MKRIIFVMLLALAFVGCGNNTPKEGMIRKQTVGTLTEDYHDEMIQISNRKDGQAFGQMILEGKMFVINPPKSFEVVESKFGKSKCKVSINGIERELWISNEFLEE